MKKNLQLSKNILQDEYIIEKILKTNKNKMYVKWRGYSNKFQLSWINKNDIKKYL